MSGEPKMFRINPENRESEALSEVEFARLGLQERRDIQEWVAANPDILGDDLLIIGKEFSGFDRTNERLDLLAVDSDGKLVIIELKRDDTGSDAHWQAIKYASYFRHASADDIVSMLANYGGMSEDEATDRLLQHLQDEDFTRLNHDQRIILASHRFAPEVTSAVLWLNEKAQYDLITCVQLVPYHDSQLDALFVQATTIIPLPGVDKYVVRVGDSSQNRSGTVRSSLGEKLARSIARNRGDEVTAFLRRVGDATINGLSDEIRPDRRSRWAGADSNGRYYHLWYSAYPWSNWGMSYRVNLAEKEAGQGQWRAMVQFWHKQSGLTQWLNDSAVSDRLANCLEIDLHSHGDGFAAEVGADTLNDDFGDRIVAVVQRFVTEITPLVTTFTEAGNEEGV